MVGAEKEEIRSGGGRVRFTLGARKRLKQFGSSALNRFRNSRFAIGGLFLIGFFLCLALDASVYPFNDSVQNFFVGFAEHVYDIYSDLLVISGFSLTFISYIVSRSEDKIQGISFQYRLKLILPDKVLKQLMFTYVAAMVLGFIILIVECYMSLLYVFVFEGMLCIVIVYSIFSVSDSRQVLKQLWDRCIDEKNGLIFRPVEVMIISIDYEDQEQTERLVENLLHAVQYKSVQVVRYRSEIRDMERDGKNGPAVSSLCGKKMNSFTYHLAKDMIEKCGVEEIFDRERAGEILLEVSKRLMGACCGQEEVTAQSVMGIVQAVIHYFPYEEAVDYVYGLLSVISYQVEAKELRSLLYTYFLLYMEFVLRNDIEGAKYRRLLDQIDNRIGRQEFTVDDLVGNYRTQGERRKQMRELWLEWCHSDNEISRAERCVCGSMAKDMERNADAFINDLYASGANYEYTSNVFRYLKLKWGKGEKYGKS